MNRMTYLALGASAVVACASSPTFAQSPAPLVVGAQAEQSNVIRSGTEINMQTRTELTSRRARVGQRFELEVVDPVTLHGQVVIPAGTVGVGEVTRVRKKGMWGRRGILETRLIHLRMGDRNIRIRGAAGDRGRAGTAGVVASLVVIPLAGFFVTGTSAVIPVGAPTIAYTEEDIPVVFAGNVGPAPLVVPAAAPVVATAPVTQASAVTPPR